MLKTIIVLPDGTEISSGVGTVNAIQSCTYTECVNSGTELTLGSVCANMIEVKFITPEGGLQIAAGDELTVYKVADDGTRHQLGIFIAEKPTRSTAYTMKLTAFDRIGKLDKDLTEWVAALTKWPYSLYDLAALVCDACGLELVNTEIPNGSYLVQAFSAEGITGRQLIQWIGEAAGRFCRATDEGKVEFAWYKPVKGHTIGPMEMHGTNDFNYSFAPETGTLTLNIRDATVSEKDGTLTVTSENVVVIDRGDGIITMAAVGDLDVAVDQETGTVTLNIPDVMITEENTGLSVTSEDIAAVDDGNGTVEIVAIADAEQHFYFQGGLTFEDYTVVPIEKVQIQGNEDDVGVIWPNIPEAVNTYRITGNMLLTDERLESLRPVAQTLHEQLKGVSYTPCRVTLPSTMDIRAGHTVSITDRNGKTITAYVMTKKQTGQKDTIECTGSIRRDSISAVNEQSYKALSGKVLNLRADVEGLKAENRAADGRAAALQLTVDGITAQVEKQGAETEALAAELTAVRQTANAVQISVQTLQENGVSRVTTEASYTFNDSGLRIAKAGEQMENLLDNTGMYVKRSGETILQANSDGVEATDVRVRNYLCVGENARFEDYESGRTACFWTGG